MVETIVIKLGGSVITEKDKKTPTPRIDALKRIAKEISQAYYQKEMELVIVHGAGSYGPPIVKQYNLQNGMYSQEQMDAFYQTKKQVNKLNNLVTKTLTEEDLFAKKIDVSSTAFVECGNLSYFSIDRIKSALEQATIPVLYGVPVYDVSRNCSILSGDKILSYVSKKLNPALVIFVTDTNGVYTSDPNKNCDAVQIKKINRQNFESIEHCLGISSHTDVTGGMNAKIREIMSLNVNSEIISGFEKGLIKETLLVARGLGTSVEV